MWEIAAYRNQTFSLKWVHSFKMKILFIIVKVFAKKLIHTEEKNFLVLAVI